MMHPVSPIDENHLLYGNFIGLQYIFESPISAQILTKAIETLTTQFPALSGRYCANSGQIKAAAKPVTLDIEKSPKKVEDILAATQRPNFINQPKRTDVLKGRAALSTFRLTQCGNGGAVFGVAISHVLSDAAGVHMLMHHLSKIYDAIEAGHTPPEFPFVTTLDAFNFGTARNKAESLAVLKTRGLPKPIPIKGLMGRFIKPIIIKAMDKSLVDNPPVKIHFTSDHVAELKETVLRESDLDWISTNVALCAHFTRLTAKLSYGDDIKDDMQIGQLLDLRGRYFNAETEAQSRFVGNAILIHIDKGKFTDGLQNTPRGVLAQYFKQRQERTNTADVKTRLDLLADCLRHGYTNPELDVKKPIIALNNQSKIPAYEITFGGQRPSRIIPQDVGDNIMFFPAQSGGIEIYIRDIVNPGRQLKLKDPDWQTQIFDF